MNTRNSGFGDLAAAVIGLAFEDIRGKPPKYKYTGKGQKQKTRIPTDIKEWLFAWYFVKCKPNEYELMSGLVETCGTRHGLRA